MRVGVDATSWGNRRGYGRFARNAVSKLIDIDPDTTYVLYVVNGSADGALPEGAEVRRLLSGHTGGAPRAADSARSPAELARMGWKVARDGVDAFLFPSVYSYFPVPRTPTVVGVHDVIADEFPDLTLPTRRARVAWRLKESLAVRRAARLFTVSAVSRSAVAARFRLPVERLDVVPEAPDAVFRPRSAAAVHAALGPLGLEPGRFLLYVGGISPHKNVEGLLAAYAAVTGRLDAPPLVIAGELDDEAYLSAGTGVRDRIAELGLSDRVVLPGFVSDEVLACLYSAATAVVNPSLAEGFGLPAVEAAACGAAVVLSDLPAHRETLDGAALFARPGDTGAWEQALARVIGDDDLRTQLQARGHKAVERLSWDTTAERLRALVLGAAGG
jgi:glycosyltransferase involved in cell wall biosynthesis